MHTLTADMIRVVRHSNGSNGPLHNRLFHVFVDRYALKDARGRMRRFALPSSARKAALHFIAEHNQTRVPACVQAGATCAGHSRGTPASEPCDASEVPARRWTRHGRTLNYDGIEAFCIVRMLAENGTAQLSPTTCDAIASYVCDVLNSVDVDALTRLWTSKP